MAKCGRRLLIVVALCLHTNISSHDLEREKNPDLYSASSHQNNTTSLVLDNTVATKQKAVSESEVYGVHILENHEANTKTLPESSTTRPTTAANKLVYSGNDTAQESTIISNMTIRGTAFSFHGSPDYLKAPRPFVQDVVTAKGDSLFDRNSTKAGLLSKRKPRDAAQPARLLYHVSVGEDCTRSMFRSDIDRPVTDCSVAALFQSNPWTNNQSKFRSLSLTTADMGLCDTSHDTGHLKTNYILDGKVTFSTENKLFLSNHSYPGPDLCIHLHSPPATIIQLTAIHVDASMKFVRNVRVELKPGQHEDISTFAKGRVLQSEKNEAFLVVHELCTEFDNSPILKTLQLAFQAVPWCMKDQLEVQCPRENKTGYIQTPHWDGLTPYNSNMNTCMTITSPADHLIMMSFVRFEVEGCNDFLEIYLSPNCTGSPVNKICRTTDASPATYQASVMSLRFKSDRSSQASGFRLLYSFHSRADPPRRLQSGKWQCSGAAGPVLVQHFICSAVTFCENAEDRVSGCLPEGLCGEISQQFDGKCSRYFQSDDMVTWLQAEKKCGKNNGHLISVNTEAKWEEVADFWINVSDADYLLVGLSQAVYLRLELYSSMWIWADKTVAYYLNIIHSPELSPPYCAMFPAHKRHLTIASCLSPAAANYLCEFGSQVDQSLIPSQKSKVLLPVPSKTASAFEQMIKCPDSHATYVFLQCDKLSYCCEDKEEEIRRCLLENPLVAETMFTCRDGKQRVHYTVVCDRHSNCADGSDEDFCTFVDCPSGYFLCRTTKKCILRGFLCDHRKQCPDGSDEQSCTIPSASNTVPPPAIINFTGTGSMTVSTVNTSHSDPVCPETHFQCPGDGYCLPVYVRCNDVFDCPGREDEADCAFFKCPGFYRCVGARNCVHADHLCDGKFQCPRHDDELMCDMICPENCICIGFAFICRNKFSANLYPQLRYLTADGTGMQLHDVTHNNMLIYLSLRYCGIKETNFVNLFNVQNLDLSYNDISSLKKLENVKSLCSLSLSFNKLLSLNSIDYANKTFYGITFLDISGSDTREVNETSFLPFPEVQYLNLSRSKLQNIRKPGFSTLLKLKVIDISECAIAEFYRQMFKGLPQLETIYASRFQMCCRSILPEHFCNEYCYFPSDGVSSCAALLRAHLFRVFLVLYAFFALVGNLYGFVCRTFRKGVTTKLGFDVFVTHLCVSDFLMGVYLAIVGIADRIYYGTYEWNDSQWKQSVACQAAGFLSLLSSEVSAFLICFITLERFLLIRFPHRNLRFTPRSAQAACVVGWMVGVLLAAIPLLPFSPAWEFYGQTGICIPLPITRKVFPGSEYSFYLMIVFNFILFLLIAAGQFLIFWSLRSQTKTVSSSSKKAKDMAIARRLLAVVMSDFLCWFPIGLLGLLARSGISVSRDVSAAMTILVLPFNSALNAFLCAVHERSERHRIARAQDNTTGEMASNNSSACTRHEQCPSCNTPSLSIRKQIIDNTTFTEEQETLDLIQESKKKILEENLITPKCLLLYLTQIVEDSQSVDIADNCQP